MAKKQTFLEDGTFFKGNIHSHTIHSDGHWKPEKSVKKYKEAGYDFMAITDHNLYSRYTEFDDDQFIVIPGFEGNVALPKDDLRQFHVVYLDEQSDWSHHTQVQVPHVKTIEEVNTYIKSITDKGFIAMLAHPTWSLTPPEQVMQIEHIQFLEVFNTGCDVLENLGQDYRVWESVIRNGKPLWGVAVDDNHNEKKGIESDSFGGWICVKAKSLNRQDILDAMKIGSFYASTGPVVEACFVEDGVVHVVCDGVSKLFINDHQRHSHVYQDHNIYTYQFDVSHWNASFILVTLVDSNGNRAWINPIYL